MSDSIAVESLRQLRLRVALTFASQFGSNLYAFALSLYVFRNTGSSISFGINMIATPIATVLLTPIIGRVVDHYRHKEIVLIAQATSVVVVMLFIFTYQKTSGFSLVLFSFIMTFALKLADEFILIALVSSSINFVIEEHQTKMRAYQQIAANVCSIISPLLGGVLFGIVHFSLIVGLEVATEVVALVIAATLNYSLIPTPDKHLDAVAGNSELAANGFWVTVKWVRRQKFLWPLIVMSSVTNALDAILFIAPPIVVLSILGMGDVLYSAAVAVMIVGEIIAGVILSRRSPGPDLLAKLYKLSFISSGLLLFLGIGGVVGGYFGYFLVVGALFFIPFVESFYNIPLQVWWVTEVPAPIQGKVFALTGSIMTGAIPLGTIIFSFVYDLPGVSLIVVNLVLVLTVMMLKCVTLAYYALVKKISFAVAHIE